MKKLLLAALLGGFSFAASANNRVDVNNMIPASCGASVTVQFVQYEIGPCTNHGYSPVYGVPVAGPSPIWDLDDPMTWLPTKLQSYQTYSAIICVTCPGLPPICLPPVGINPPTCDPSVVGPVPYCCGNMVVDVTSGGGPVCFHINIHP